MIVGLNDSFQVADHDFSRGSLIPSVSLEIEIPETASESFYNGTVYVAVKDAVFKPSSPCRHAAELSAILSQKTEVPPVLILYTDGGPDHRCNYLSVIYSMVSLFIEHDLDALVLGRNAPGHSWHNPAERVMSVLNLGLQSVGIMRASSDLENLITK